MYINFWYPVCISDELKIDEPLQAKILGLSFVAFRDSEGSAHVLADTCVHRGGSLGKGKVQNGRIACPYHGWQYGGDGKCKYIPVLGKKGNIPPRAKVDSYPVTERYGIVFAFLGDEPAETRAPLFEIPEWEKPGWRASGLVIFNLDAYFERSIENGLDPVHNEFVHPLQGNLRYQPDRTVLTKNDWGSGIKVRMDPPGPGATELEYLRNDEDDLKHFGATSFHQGPNTLVTEINLSKENTFIQYFFEQPVNSKLTRIFFINMRSCLLDPSNDERLQKINLAIADEDIAVVSKLYPLRTPESSNREILILGDECIGEFRNSLKKWEGLGWRIDMKKMEEASGDVAFAIPCPDRRNSKNWVLESIPLKKNI
ncbi:MAG: aromatic ring-hydroxylating dioxygenase subunit alpha [Pseudomonadota bacterium]|nr:aromatic ring-hydroxylating dioxygenase subunit alpha [Pseudomonadota bacterium]